MKHVFMKSKICFSFLQMTLMKELFVFQHDFVPLYKRPGKPKLTGAVDGSNAEKQFSTVDVDNRGDLRKMLDPTACPLPATLDAFFG